MEVKLVRTEADIEGLSLGDQYTFDDGTQNNALNGPINLLDKEAEKLRLRELIDQKFSRVLAPPAEVPTPRPTPRPLPPRTIDDDLDDERTFGEMGGTRDDGGRRSPRRLSR